MKSEPGLTLAPAPDWRGFFLALEQPAALLCAGLQHCAHNPAFERLCAEVGEGPAGLCARLALLLRGPGGLPAAGAARTLRLVVGGGRELCLRVARAGSGQVAVTAEREGALAPGPVALAADPRLLEVGRAVAGARGEEALTAALAHGMRTLFPGRTFALRVLQPGADAPALLLAEGALRAGAADEPLVLRPVALEKTGLALEALPERGVRVADAPPPLLLEGSVAGACAPLVASGRLLGVLHLEYPAGAAGDPARDAPALFHLANQLAVALGTLSLARELSHSRRNLEELLEGANALVVASDRQRRVTVFNAALRALTGFTSAEALGQDVRSFVPEDERERITQLLQAAWTGQAVNAVEARVRTRDGDVRRVAFSTATLRSATGEVEGFIAIGSDVTRVRALEQRAAQTEKLATLGRLAARVAHEINNPMTSVATYAEALLHAARVDPHAPPGQQDKLRRILDGSHRILRFTRDLIRYARPPAPERHERLHLHDALEQALSYCELPLTQARVRVVRAWDAHAGHVVLGAAGPLVQVFVNLVTNACHAMPQGGTLTLRLREERGGPGPAEVVAEVEDSGAGIAAEDLPRIFEPFFTTKPEGQGSGLGLAIVNNVVEGHGGRLAVHSRPGEGTVFTLRLPAAG